MHDNVRVTADLDPQGWAVPGDRAAAPDLDLTQVTSRAEARALAEAAEAQAPGATDVFAPPRRSAVRPPITPAPVPSPHIPASHVTTPPAPAAAPAVPGQWGAAAPTPPRPYTPVAAPPPPVAPPPLEARRSGLSVFGTVIRVLALVCAVGYAAQGLAALWASNAVLAHGAVPGGLFGALNPLRLVGGAVAGPLASAAFSIVSLATQISLIVWLAMVSVDRRTDRRRVKHGPVGTVLGFLVPVISCWWPYQSLRDAWRATDLRPGSKPTPMTIIAWWTLTIAAAAVGGFLGGLEGPRLVTGDVVGLQSGILTAVGVGSLILVGAQLCLSFAIGQVCFHLDAHDLLVQHQERTHPSVYRAV